MLKCGCMLETSGVIRDSSKVAPSAVQRMTNFEISRFRIRVENFIGAVKQRFKILGKTLPIEDLALSDRIVQTCFLMYNFGPALFRKPE